MEYFAHRNIIRKSVISFMTLFDKIWIEKYRTNGTSKLFRVPIQFANREKWLQQLQSRVHFAGNHDGFHNNTRFEIDMIFPRISANITSLSYDTMRKVGKTNKLFSCEACSLNELNVDTSFAPAPWNLEFELAIISKNMDDGLQIIEQIVPFFQPSLSVNIKYLEGFASDSVPIILDSITPTHDEDLDADVERNFIWILTFRMKINFHMPKKIKGRIDDVIMNLHPNEKGAEYDQLTQFQLNAEKLENINQLSDMFALIYDREQETIQIQKNSENEIRSFEEEFKDVNYQLSLMVSQGEFDYTADEFYMTDLAGTTTYLVQADFNLIKIKTSTSDEAIGAPQIVQFEEVTSGNTFMMAISDTGDLEISH